jgi:hypothetical protein
MMTVDQLVDHALGFAQRVLIEQPNAQIMPSFLIQYKNGRADIIATPWTNDDDKAIAIALIRFMLKSHNIHSYSFISEAWVANEDTRHPIRLMPRDREDRRETVLINAFNREGGKVRCYEIKRGPDGVVTELVPEKVVPLSWEGQLHNLFDDDD